MFNHPANPISAWHGASAKNLDSICWYGLLNLTNLDPGMRRFFSNSFQQVIFIIRVFKIFRYFKIVFIIKKGITGKEFI